MAQTPSTELREPSPALTPGRGPADIVFSCGHCQRSFRRPEHLKRHEKSHTSPMAHKCSTCGKRFARSDVLLRHEYVHRSIDKSDGGTHKQKRACLPCSKARERCTRTEPCSRCTVKSIECQYRLHEKTSQRRKPDTEDCLATVGGSEDAILLPPSPHSGLSRRPNDSGDSDAQIQVISPGLNTAEDIQAEMRSTTSRHQQSTTGGSYHAYYGSKVTSPNTWRAEHQSQLLGLVTPSIAAYPPNAGLGNGPDVNWLPTSDDWNMGWTSVFDLGLGSDMTFPPTGGPSPSVLAPAPRAIAGNGGADPHTVITPSASALPGTPSTRGSQRSDERGRLYATSSGARATAYEQDSQPDPLITGAHAQVPISKLLRTDVKADETSIHGLTPRYTLEPDFAKSVWQSTYEHILHEFRRLHRNVTKGVSESAEEGFLTMNQFDMIVQLFFNRFLPSLPIFHETLSGPNEFWILTLAMATIGCHYTKTEEFDNMVIPLHNFLASALQEEADVQREPAMELHYLQAFLLSQIGLIYYGPTDVRNRALLSHASLIRRAESLGLFSSSAGYFYDTEAAGSPHASSISDATARWRIWVKHETARRLGYSIWILDVMGCYHFGLRSLLPSQLPSADLPHDGLWAAPSEQDWSLVLGRTERNPPLDSAVRRLFIDREIKPDLGEFSRIIVLHGLYHEIQQVKSYVQRPLSSWIPTAPGKSSSREENSNAASLVPHETETFTAWRNASLDCVDVLHWWANGVIALHSGMEHTTVLHLHMSRIILLVSIDSIIILVESIINRAIGLPQKVSAAEVHKAESEVLRWAHRDESKARLTLIHCGVTWWHLRRFSAAAFYEPQSIYLATLTLWAYSYYVSRSAQTSGAAPADTDHESDSESSSEPEFIWLDRPNDDEMVQFFVRKGRPDRVKAFVSGVGDIFEPQSPAKILKEGLKIIEKVAFPWGRESEYVRTLQIASQVMANAKE